LLPPLVITPKEVDYFLMAFESILIEFNKFPGPVWSLGSSLVKHAIAAQH